jgi:hypothetical protein
VDGKYLKAGYSQNDMLVAEVKVLCSREGWKFARICRRFIVDWL